MDRSDAQSVVVEAESWQKALQAARVARGEIGPISGFSIELLDEGYRAVDPLARLRYDVKRASETAVATLTAAPSNAPPPVASVPPPPGVPRPAKAAPSYPAKRTPQAPPVAPKSTTAAPPPAPPVAPSTPPPPPAPIAAAPAPPAPAPIVAPAPVTVTPTPLAPVVAAPAPPPPPAVQPGSIIPQRIVSISPESPTDETIPTAALSDDDVVPLRSQDIVPLRSPEAIEHALRQAASHDAPRPPHEPPRPPPPVHAVTAAPSLESLGPLPPTQIIFKREHDRTERTPLTYREYVFTVARGVDETAAERLLRVQLEQVRASIASAPPGKFVNLAVFDVVFQGRPPVRPLATLAWKDWRGEPAVSFPRSAPSHQAHAPAPARPAPAPIPMFAQTMPMPLSAPPAPAPVASAPPIAPPPAPIPSAPPPPPPIASAPPPPPVANNPFMAPAAPAFAVPVADPFAPGAAPLPHGVPVPGFPPPVAMAPPPPPAVAAGFPPAVASAPTAAHVGSGFPPPVAAPAPFPPAVAAAPFPPAVAVAPFAPPATFPAPLAHSAPIAPDASNGPIAAARSSAQRMTPTPSRPSLRPLAAGRRATGDELIANLFEAMHELNFTRDIVEGGDYCLSLALEMIPSRAGLLHLYDIDRREFVVACASGPGTEGLLTRRNAENEPLLATAMRRHRAVIIADARTDELALAERFLALGTITTLICSPVLKGGRWLGAIELMNPLDGVSFTEHEGNAVDYISEQFAEFVASRGMDLDEDRISRRAPPMA